MSRFKTIRIEPFEWRVDILNVIMWQLQFMTMNCRRVLFVRIDITFPTGYPQQGQNTEISDLLHHLDWHYGHQNIRVACVWVREQKDSSNPHYHCIFLFDNNHVRTGEGVRNEIAKAWHSIVKLQGYNCVDLALADGVKQIIEIRKPLIASEGEKLRQEIAAFNANLLHALDWSTYLAKTVTKDKAPKGIRAWGGTRIPRDAGPLSFPPYFHSAFPPYTPPQTWGR